jgi:hypothetical protein
MSGEAFFRIVERLRLALLTTVELTDRERRLALLMVERIHRRSYENAGTLISWLSVPTIAALTGMDERSIKRLRQSLRAKSVVYVEQEGGRGPRSTAVYAFDRRWIERNAPAIGGNGGWTSGRPEPEADREPSVPGPSQTGEWVASTATLRNDMGGHSTHPRMALETPLKGGLGGHPTPLNTKPMIEPLEAHASASARKGRDVGRSVRTEPIVDPASLADAKFATWLSSARDGMQVPLVRLAESSNVGEASLVAIEDGQVIAIPIVRSRIIRGLKHLASGPPRTRMNSHAGHLRGAQAAAAHTCLRTSSECGCDSCPATAGMPNIKGVDRPQVVRPRCDEIPGTGARSLSAMASAAESVWRACEVAEALLLCLEIYFCIDLQVFLGIA